MPHSEENTKNLFDICLLASIFLFLFSIFYFGYGFWQRIGLMPSFLTKAFSFLHGHNPEFFNSNVVINTVSVFLAVVYIGGTKVKKKFDTDQMGKDRNIWYKIFNCLPKQSYLFLSLFFGAIYIFSLWLSKSIAGGMTGATVFVILSVASFILLFKFATAYKKHFKYNDLDDKFNRTGEIFDNETRYMPGDYSVNIPLKPKSWLNIINVFAGTIVTGNPGTGKSYVVFCEYILQLMKKGFAMVLYDYKRDEDNLTDFAFNVYRQYRDEVRKGFAKRGLPMPTFHVVDFERPKFNIQVNPLHPNKIKTPEDVSNAATIFFLNLNKNYAEKMGDFFLESGKLFIELNMTLLRYTTLKGKTSKRMVNENGELIYKEVPSEYQGNCSSVPHLLTLLQFDQERVYKIFSKLRETKSGFSVFRDAIDREADEQLAGQIASGKLPLASLSTPNIFWTLSGDELDLDVRDPLNPKILCIRNTETKPHAYSPVIGLLVGELLNFANKESEVPVLFGIDELDTVFIYDLDKIISTARSKKLAVLLGFQDFQQLTKGYGKKVADVTINVAGNVITGAVRGQTAKMYQELFGRVKQKRVSVSSNKMDTSTTISSQMEFLLPQSSISQLSQGELVGKVSDTLQNQLETKIFRGSAVIDHNERVRLKQLRAPIQTPFPDIEAKAKDRLREEIRGNYNGWQSQKIDDHSIEAFTLKRYDEIEESLFEEMKWDNKQRIENEVEALILQLENELE